MPGVTVEEGVGVGVEVAVDVGVGETANTLPEIRMDASKSLSFMCRKV
jgi:hypothetical protein